MARLAGLVLLALVFLVGCKVEVYVQPVTEDIVDVEVEGESIPPEGGYVEVSKVSPTTVTWSYEGERDSERVEPVNAYEGAVWTVYADYVEID